MFYKPNNVIGATGKMLNSSYLSPFISHKKASSHFTLPTYNCTTGYSSSAFDINLSTDRIYYHKLRNLDRWRMREMPT
jgi:hypothetical protein